MNKDEYLVKQEEIKSKIKENQQVIKELKQEKKANKKTWRLEVKPISNRKLIKKANKAKKREENIQINQPPHLSVLEEIGNAITHGLGCIFAIVTIVLMVSHTSTGYQMLGGVIYGACMLVLFLMSCLYHSFRYGSTVKRVFRRFDYSSIYLLIGGTFAPILLVFLGNTLGIVIFIIQWVVIITGITMVAVFGPGRLKWLHFPLYFALGWLAGIFVIPSMIKDNINLFWWILAGGLVYTLGMIPFCMGEKKNAHFIWHFFVLIGAILQWVGIYIYLF